MIALMNVNSNKVITTHSLHKSHLLCLRSLYPKIRIPHLNLDTATEKLKWILSAGDIKEVFLSQTESVSSSIISSPSLLRFPQDFDISLAVSLAGCAFEAYTNPNKAEGLPEIAVNGTCTSYLSKDYLLACYDGVLELNLKSASRLKPRDLFGKCDPYAVLSVGDSTATSKIISQTLEPEWNQTFHLYVKDKEKDILRIRIFDQDKFKSNDACGVAMFPLSKIPEKLRHLSLDLKDDGENAKLHISVKFLPFYEDTNSVTPVEGPLDLIEERVSRALNVTDQMSFRFPNAWKALSVMAGRAIETHFDPICYIENGDTDTQLWIYTNKELKEVVVAFRGTDQLSIKDLATDTNIQPVPFDLERTGVSSFVEGLANQSSNTIQVHKGFLDAYDSVKGRVFSILDSITERSTEWSICLTGHSLGGALATLCAYELVTRKYKNKGPSVKIYTFGCPRVGNQAFVKSYNENVKVSWRIYNKRDLIPTLPALSGYCHVDHGILLNAEGTLEFEKKENFDVVQQAKLKAEVIPETPQNEMEAKSFDEVGKRILGIELEFITLLIDGSGLSEHMENYYYKSINALLKTVIEKAAEL